MVSEVPCIRGSCDFESEETNFRLTVGGSSACLIRLSRVTEIGRDPEILLLVRVTYCIYYKIISQN